MESFCSSLASSRKRVCRCGCPRGTQSVNPRSASGALPRQTFDRVRRCPHHGCTLGEQLSFDKKAPCVKRFQKRKFFERVMFLLQKDKR